MLRIREEKIRIRFYIENIAVSVMGILFLFLWQTVMYLIGYFMYSRFVPYNNQPQHGLSHIWSAELMQKIYPSFGLLFIIVPICVAVLLPTLSLLIAFAERSKRNSVLALLGIGFGIFGIYAMWEGMKGYPLVLIAATFITVILGIFYINKVQLV